jgi:hypothetical protein
MLERWLVATWLVALAGGLYWGRKSLRHLTPLGNRRRRRVQLGSSLWWSAEHYSREGDRYRRIALLFVALWIGVCFAWIATP